MTEISFRKGLPRLLNGPFTSSELRQAHDLPAPYARRTAHVMHEILEVSLNASELFLPARNHHRELQSQLLDSIKREQWDYVAPSDIEVVSYGGFAFRRRSITINEEFILKDPTLCKLTPAERTQIARGLRRISNVFNEAHESSLKQKVDPLARVKSQFMIETWFRRRLVIPQPTEINAAIREEFSDFF